MLNKNQKFGKESEDLAVRSLKKQGYKIIEKNYRCKLGEIDIIAKDKDTIVFIEVKARSSDYFGDAKSGVSPQKQMKISMVALYYLKETDQNGKNARFDVVAIDKKMGKQNIEIVKNAFDLAYS